MFTVPSEQKLVGYDMWLAVLCGIMMLGIFIRSWLVISFQSVSPPLSRSPPRLAEGTKPNISANVKKCVAAKYLQNLMA